MLFKRLFPLCSFHPYLFFNQDGISFTFVGFYVTENGDAIDPATSRVIMPKIMSADLRLILSVNKINLSENFRRWKRCVNLVVKFEYSLIKDSALPYLGKNSYTSWLLLLD